MLDECIQGLNIKEDGVYVDVTFGGGGHSKAILNKLGPKGKLIAFDQDQDAANNRPADERLVFVQHNFKYLKQFLKYLNVVPVDGILADLGISSYQINEASKGFAHRFDAPLDMRMDQSNSVTAAQIINTYSEKALLNIFNHYGEIKNTYKLVQVILEKRSHKPIHSIAEFKAAIASCTPAKEESKYLSQVFQALRIEVNQELAVIEEFLAQAPAVLKPAGRLVIMSFHSLEDRLVKNYMKRGSFEGEVQKDFFGNVLKPLNEVVRHPIVPSEEEIQRNTRARSAKLRIAEKNVG
jgi:16S rRNA (cytosine1402-N4)-methyltransferase